MTKRHQVYRCEVCGNIIEVIHPSVGKLVCCDQPMTLQEEHLQDKGKEKHVPIIAETESGVRVTVGEIPHPMEEKHFIEWIEIIANGRTCRSYLKPGMPPEATFAVQRKDIEAVREYCNVHGLWKV